MASPMVFLITYIIISSSRPEYSIFTKAISELGSSDITNKWAWNSFGYIIPGLLISLYAHGLYLNIRNEKSSKLPLFGILFSGIFMSMSGIFPGDFENKQSTGMLLHSIGSIASYICFLIGAFTFPKLMKKNDYWKKTSKPTLLFTFSTILFGFWPFIFPNIPALGQRFVFFFYFLWIFYTALKLFNNPRSNPHLTKE